MQLQPVRQEGKREKKKKKARKDEASSQIKGVIHSYSTTNLPSDFLIEH
jgi:hypothetical protein